MSDQQPLSLNQFQGKFSSKEARHSHLFTMKWLKGFHCAKCGHDQYYECRQCGFQATVIVGTVMEKTRVDLTK